jgi:hypothetical protein
MIGPKMQQSCQYTWIFKKYANTFAKDKHMPLVGQGSEEPLGLLEGVRTRLLTAAKWGGKTNDSNTTTKP